MISIPFVVVPGSAVLVRGMWYPEQVVHGTGTVLVHNLETVDRGNTHPQSEGPALLLTCTTTLHSLHWGTLGHHLNTNKSVSEL